MRKYCQLIDTNYLFERSLIDGNTDPKLLNSSIRDAQEIHIQAVLGNSLYNKIMADAYDSVIDGAYESLLKDWIQPALSHWAVYLVIPYLNFKFTNKSVSELSGQNSAPTELNNIKYLRDDSRNKAEFYTQRIREEIVNNQASYPEYYTSTGIDQIQPMNRSYFSGVWTKYGPDCFDPNGPDATIRIK